VSRKTGFMPLDRKGSSDAMHQVMTGPGFDAELHSAAALREEAKKNQ
jgi:hypothetical protein